MFGSMVRNNRKITRRIFLYFRKKSFQ